MIINSDTIINLPVETQSGKRLGRVICFEIDSESQSVTKYLIKIKNLPIANLFGEELIVDRGQVISLTNKKMIVEDNVNCQKKDVLSQTSSIRAQVRID